jgi:hypothetical protein
MPRLPKATMAAAMSAAHARGKRAALARDWRIAP